MGATNDPAHDTPSGAHRPHSGASQPHGGAGHPHGGAGHPAGADLSGDEVLRRVEGHLTGWFGPDSGRASLTFLGADPVEVLRFGPDPDGVVRYVTLGMAREPMSPAESTVRDPAGPRAELVLSLRGRRDDAARALAVLASVPVVEGRPVVAGSGLDLGEPLWDGGRFTAVLVGEPGGLVPDLPLAAGDQLSAAERPAGAAPAVPAPVQFLPLLPMTPNEAAYKRVHGATAIRQRWLDAGTDLRDPDRAEVGLS
ncbi:Suppressor of fused protein (SUFU) [Frankia sp. EI5c]|uniref:suppressor of fused domain protein n=1 Tax=Frankia sp. EI5c TaxID=683316 RepID=UPI0007C32E87|nr:suppressor of fused domain protein [Frankia sp. EI5c]OAA24157.1 Suppressor of fused protein (SUFU) [Frankia sp. EI5c]